MRKIIQKLQLQNHKHLNVFQYPLTRLAVIFLAFKITQIHPKISWQSLLFQSKQSRETSVLKVNYQT
jgi:hypothetical protein